MRRGDVDRTVRELVSFGAEHRRLLTGMILLLVLNVLFFLIFTSRSATGIRELKADLKRSKADLAEARRSLDKNDRKKALGRLVERELGDLYNSVLLEYDENFHNVRMEIQSILKEVKIDANQISYQRGELPAVKLIQETISFPLKGDYRSLRKLLSLIEQSDQFLIIDSIQLADSSNEGKELNLNISLVTFFYEPELEEGDRRRRPT